MSSPQLKTYPILSCDGDTGNRLAGAQLEPSKRIESVSSGSRAIRNLDGPGDPQTVGYARVSAGFFDLMGERPQLGRWFDRNEETPNEAPVAIVSDSAMATAVLGGSGHHRQANRY